MRMCYFIVLLLATLAVATVQAGNATWGTRSLRDMHLKRAVIYEKARMWRRVTTDFVFEQKGVLFSKTITQIVAADQHRDGKGGTVKLIKGGPHERFVKLHFTSQRGHGINFIVDIYGI